VAKAQLSPGTIFIIVALIVLLLIAFVISINFVTQRLPWAPGENITETKAFFELLGVFTVSLQAIQQP
jgi:hypothetical protein